ncbi:MAG: hypothetical protein AAFR67_17900 [Chloroflexota bacterium]
MTILAKQNQRWLAFVGLATVIVLAVIPYFRPVTPLIIEETVGNSQVYIEANYSWLLFPGRCMMVRWELEDIQGVYLTDLTPERGTVGVGEQRDCYAPNFSLRVIFPDDSTKTYTLDTIIYGYQQIHWQLYYALLLIMSAMLAYMALGARAVTAIVTTIAITPTMIFYIMHPYTGYIYVANGDYIVHIRWAQIASLQTLNELPPHMLFHFIGRGFIELMPSLLYVIPIIIFMVICQVITAVGLHTILRVMHPVERTDHLWHILHIAVAVMLLFVGPLCWAMVGIGVQQT